MNYVIKKHNVNIISIIGVLSDPKLEGILKPEYYNDLKKYISIEKYLDALTSSPSPNVLETRADPPVPNINPQRTR